MNQIHFVGYDARHTSDFVFDIPHGHNCYLLILTHTPAQFEQEGDKKEYPAHQAILYPPHHKIWYAACGEHYGNDWLRFSTDETFVTEFPLIGEPFPVSDSEYCHILFKLLTWEQAQQNQEDVVTSLLRILFYKLREDITHQGITSQNQALLQLRKNITNAPQLDWKIADMASQLHISTGYLQLLYKRQFGISCMDDVIRCRLRMARDYLAYTDQNIMEIAQLCGYHNVEHFCRQFRKFNKETPGQFRRKSHEASETTRTRHRTVTGSYEEH